MSTIDRVAALLIEHNRSSVERCACGWGELGKSHPEHVARSLVLAGLIATPEHDELVRFDERARVSVVHSTLTSEQLVAELVRRGVLEERREHRDRLTWGACWTHGLNVDACDATCTYRDERFAECRLVGPWQPDTRTDEQRSDDAITTLRRRFSEGVTS